MILQYNTLKWQSTHSQLKTPDGMMPHQHGGGEKSRTKATTLHCCRNPDKGLSGLAMLLPPFGTLLDCLANTHMHSCLMPNTCHVINTQQHPGGKHAASPCKSTAGPPNTHQQGRITPEGVCEGGRLAASTTLPTGNHSWVL